MRMMWTAIRLLMTPMLSALMTRIARSFEIFDSPGVNWINCINNFCSLRGSTIVRTAIELSQLQRADADIAPLINAIERDENPPNWNEIADWSAASKSLWLQWRRLQICKGVLHRRFESSDARRISWQIELLRSERKLFMQLIHAGIGGGHLGRHRTMLAIQARAY
jgi:hypothetical protein